MTYELVTLILGLLAIAAAWDGVRRISGSKLVALQDEVTVLKSRVSLLNTVRDEEGLAARVETLEAHQRGMKNQLESIRPQRPWGAVRSRTGA